MNKPCAYPSCPNLIKIRSGRYCDAHARPDRDYKAEAKARYQAPEENMMAMKYRNSTEWRKIRAHKLRMNPLCEDPHGWHNQKNSTETATQVHHIKSIATHYHLRSTIDNLMSICYKCHAKFNVEERQADRLVGHHTHSPT